VDYNIYTNGKISSALVKLKATRLLKVHAGTVLRFADAEIEILCTHEELYPGVLGLEYTNDTSIVSRVRLGGQTIIFPGDMQTLESNVLVSMYGTYLKSDFVQISHHGSIKYPATLEFYQMVSPTWAFFPGSKSRYAENAGTPENSYLIKRLGAGNIFVADSENRTISLPFGR
jgi:beta-lactamase superfamily II metal-dependent hydrolase